MPFLVIAAAKAGNVLEVHLLLAAGANINEQNEVSFGDVRWARVVSIVSDFFCDARSRG